MPVLILEAVFYTDTDTDRHRHRHTHTHRHRHTHTHTHSHRHTDTHTHTHTDTHTYTHTHTHTHTHTLLRRYMSRQPRQRHIYFNTMCVYSAIIATRIQALDIGKLFQYNLDFY